jgi:hypothetical protein
VESITDDAPLGANSVEADGANPRSGDAARGLRRDLVVGGLGPSMLGCTTSRVPVLHLLGFPSLLSLPIN